MINLKDVTLISICNQAYLQKTKKAMDYCATKANFYDKILIQDENINEISYAKTCIFNLKNYIASDFCMVVQWDGFIIDETMWNDEFLDYDYIGAPWGFPEDCRNRVGNGGFSIRSKKFLNVSSTVEYRPFNYDAYLPIQLVGRRIAPEDWFLCYDRYYYLIENGIKFPSIDLAYSFAVEHPSFMKKFDREDISTYKSFGFHGDFNTAAMRLLEEK